MHSPLRIVDQAQSHCSRPSPPAEFDKLEVSTNNQCWPSHTDPCWSMLDLYITFMSSWSSLHPLLMGKSQWLSPHQCQSFDVDCIYSSLPFTGFQVKLQDPLSEEVDYVPSIFTVVDILYLTPALQHIYCSRIPLSPRCIRENLSRKLPLILSFGKFGKIGRSLSGFHFYIRIRWRCSVVKHLYIDYYNTTWYYDCRPTHVINPIPIS